MYSHWQDPHGYPPHPRREIGTTRMHLSCEVATVRSGLKGPAWCCRSSYLMRVLSALRLVPRGIDLRPDVLSGIAAAWDEL